MRCTGHIIKGGVCNNRGARVPVGIGVSNIVPVVFTSSVLVLPAVVLSFVSGRRATFTEILGLFDIRKMFCTIVCFLLVVNFTCFCTAVRFGPIRVTGGLHGGNNTVPNVHPNRPAASFVSGVLSEVALLNTLFLDIITVLPVTINGVNNVGVSLNNASMLVVINITLSAMHDLRSRVVVHRCGKFLS